MIIANTSTSMGNICISIFFRYLYTLLFNMFLYIFGMLLL